MVRMQVQFTDAQAQRLHRLAADRHVSIAELVREAVDARFAATVDDERWTRLLQELEKGHSGLTDVSERHDDYLAESYTE